MAEVNTACTFTDVDLEKLREPVQLGLTRPEAWRREQLRRLRALVCDHEAEILEALRNDLAKPDLEGMAELVTVLQ